MFFLYITNKMKNRTLENCNNIPKHFAQICLHKDIWRSINLRNICTKTAKSNFAIIHDNHHSMLSLYWNKAIRCIYHTSHRKIYCLYKSHSDFACCPILVYDQHHLSVHQQVQLVACVHAYIFLKSLWRTVFS